jgi:predicted nucleic acid-binding protein
MQIGSRASSSWDLVVCLSSTGANTRRENERSLNEFLTRFPILEYDAAAAVEFGLIKFALWRIRRPISDVDVQIAAIGRTRGMTVLTAEQHFMTVPKLRVENWLV